MGIIKQVIKPRSYDAAKKIAAGNVFSGSGLMLQATGSRALLILPAFRLMGVPWKKSIYGALLGSSMISAGLITFYMIDKRGD